MEHVRVMNEAERKIDQEYEARVQGGGHEGSHTYTQSYITPDSRRIGKGVAAGLCYL